MSAPICLYCGYSRAVQVAGCEHATLPTAGPEMVRPTREEVIHAATGVALKEDGKVLLRHCLALEERAKHEQEKSALLAAELVDLQRQVVALQEEKARLEQRCATYREEREAERDAKGALQERLNAMHVELLAESAELEQERRVSGRLRADLEMAQQMLSAENAP